jgi:hypothetical protein
MKNETKLVIWGRLRIIDKIGYNWGRFNKIGKIRYIKIRIVIYKTIE